jgi:hypothetical protein
MITTLKPNMTEAEMAAHDKKLVRVADELVRYLRIRKLSFGGNIVVMAIALANLVQVEGATSETHDKMTAVFVQALKTALARHDQ